MKIKYSLTLVVIFLMSCSSFSKKEANANNDIFSIKSFIPKDEKVIKLKLYSKYLIALTSERESGTYYYVFNLENKKLLKKIKSPIGKIMHEKFCVSDNVLYCRSAVVYGESKIFFISLNNIYNITWDFLYSQKEEPFYRDILVKNNFVLYDGNTRGVFIENLTSNEKLSILPRGYTQFFDYGYYAKPIKENFVTGVCVESNIYRLFSIDTNFDVNWKFNYYIEQIPKPYLQKETSLLNTDRGTIVGIGNVVDLIDNDGEKVNLITIKQEISNLFLFKGELFVVSHEFDERKKNSTYKIVLYDFEKKNLTNLYEFHESYKPFSQNGLHVFHDSERLFFNRSKLYIGDYHKGQIIITDSVQQRFEFAYDFMRDISVPILY